MNEYFCVWKGKEPGVYTSWSECMSQFKEIRSPLFKRFDSIEEAQKASKESAHKYFELDKTDQKEEFVTVGLASSNKGSSMRFWLFDNEELKLFFKSPDFLDTSIEEGAYLGIVQAMEFMRLKEDIRPIQCANAKAIGWIKDRKVLNSKLKSRNSSFLKKTEKAQSLLASHNYLNEIVLSQSS